MKKRVLSVFMMTAVLMQAGIVQAKVWRINNATGVSADFKEVSAAIASSLVTTGDTLYIEGSASNYNSITLTKKLVLIGSGYLLSGAGANTGLQAMGLSTKIASILIDSVASGSTFMGFSAPIYLNANVDDVTITRCEGNITVYTPIANAKIANLIINKYIGYADLSSTTVENIKVTNCIFLNAVTINKVINGLVRNNIFVSTATIANSYVSNNIFLNTLTVSTSTVKYNLASGINALPAGNNNQNGVSATVLFENTGSSDGKYQLKAGSPAIGAGEPIGGITPDAGAFGTADPYRLSGIPPIPTIYSLTVPPSIPASATTIDITFSTRSNN
jgi:hypothetical protein